MKPLTGHEAIEFKRANPNSILYKYADPTEDARRDISLEDAEDVVLEDPSLIYIVVD
jgi:hypothetical protein